MKPDREQKRAILGEHLSEFPDYTALDLGETDLQLRRFLAGRLEEVRDRLADFIAGAGQLPRRGGFSAALREIAALKERILLPVQGSHPVSVLSARQEEQVFDLDLALLERIAALHSPLDRLEQAVSSPELQQALDLFAEGLREIAELFARRGKLLASLQAEKA